ncbi:hypothetical protein N657DRAFT_54685 [Parathielavia appendiculata]|uniref:Uncharacterized protein n=1 Tax=Parathielavia appendiculata TaxID=2587402 RepID=A0AAN6U9W6_9PEZI|nr:hypothetical protein N657DRAFT_54685 [Parathielavia appendiculata]
MQVPTHFHWLAVVDHVLPRSPQSSPQSKCTVCVAVVVLAPLSFKVFYFICKPAHQAWQIPHLPAAAVPRATRGGEGVDLPGKVSANFPGELLGELPAKLRTVPTKVISKFRVTRSIADYDFMCESGTEHCDRLCSFVSSTAQKPSGTTRV